MLRLFWAEVGLPGVLIYLTLLIGAAILGLAVLGIAALFGAF